MTGYFGYIRVSTARQGERGVSLQEQRDAIDHYARRHGLTISEWFEERETAAKRGRPAFNDMLRRLRRRQATGVIIHKIDRSARNLKDWAELGELIDLGVEVHFAHESLDLHSRGGRLTADIQAVVAADYVRNLRDEARKGFYGRLKQGCYPLPAPVGYLDQGAGEPKAIDPVKGPLVRQAFELYSTGNYTLATLADRMKDLGLRNRNDTPITLNGFSTLLNNPFYYGLIRIRATNEIFEGAHEPLVSKKLFDRVQVVLRGKCNLRLKQHAFAFRRLLACGHCGYSLIGERQKGHVYYRCHTRTCPTKGVREEVVDKVFAASLEPLSFSEHEQAYLASKLTKIRGEWLTARDEQLKRTRLQVQSVSHRLERLTDAYVDGLLDQELFTERKNAFVTERRELNELLETLEREPTAGLDRLAEFLELAGSASLQYETALAEEKRDFIATITSNRVVTGRKLAITLLPPFQLIAEREKSTNGRAYRDEPRTLDVLLSRVIKAMHVNQSRLS